jgi:hypothetical protein
MTEPLHIVGQVLNDTTMLPAVALELRSAICNGQAQPLGKNVGNWNAAVAATVFQVRLESALQAGLSPVGMEDLINALQKYDPTSKMLLFHFDSSAHLFTLVVDEKEHRFVGCLRINRGINWKPQY